MRPAWWLAVTLFACGDVNKVPDAAVPDAYQADSPQMTSCAAGQMVCNSTCVDVMTSEQFCGNCSTQCTPNQGCAAGSCVPANTSCSRVREIDATAPDGVYTNPNNGAIFACDFTANTSIEDFVINPYTIVPTNYTVVRSSDFANPLFVKAFIAFYNKNGGTRTVNTFTTSNCCMGPIAGTRYQFGGQALFTGSGTSGFCNQPITGGTVLTFGRNGNNYATTLPDDYFTTNPVTESGVCGDGNNAAWYVRRTPIN